MNQSIDELCLNYDTLLMMKKNMTQKQLVQLLHTELNYSVELLNLLYIMRSSLFKSIIFRVKHDSLVHVRETLQKLNTKYVLLLQYLEVEVKEEEEEEEVVVVEDNSTVDKFVQETIIKTNNLKDRLTVASILSIYRNWATSNNITPLTRNELTKVMNKRFGTVVRNAWKGLTLKQDNDSDSDSDSSISESE